jgi:hypothetical protein
MEVVYFVERPNYAKVKDSLLADDVVARQSVIFKDAQALDIKKDGFFLKLSGSDEALQKAKEIIGELGKVVDKKEAEEVVNKIKKEEENAAEGFGNILGF